LRIVIALLDLREVNMDRRMIELYDEYAHAPLERRVFLDRLAALAGGTARLPCCCHCWKSGAPRRPWCRLTIRASRRLP
jgi:hypothetical protein